jgi:mannan endo-1,6-alpha-mannosidase
MNFQTAWFFPLALGWKNMLSCLKTNGSPQWKQRLDNLITPTFQIFFPSKYGSNIMSEVSCEAAANCDRNSICFKGFLSSWLAFTSILAPYTYGEILPKLQASAQAAAKQCSGGSDGEHCGIRWYQSTWDGSSGLEEQMAALSVFSSNMIAFMYTPPLTSSTGGNSTSDPNAGLSGSDSATTPGVQTTITTADRAGAGIITAVFLTSWVGMVSWMVLER